MKNIVLLFLFLIPAFLFAQYPATGNKSRLGYQTTGDGLIWRGVAADTAIKPRTTANAYFQLDTVNRILRRYIATQGSWQVVGGGGSSIDSLVYSTIKGLNDSIQAEKQTLAFATPLLGISDGNNVDLSPLLTGYVTGSGTNNRVPKWSATSNLTDSNIQDDGTAVSILSNKPFQLGQWTTAGRPSGVNGYVGFNTSFNWPEWYSSSGWFSPARAITTGGAFTAGYIPFGGTGGLTESANLYFDATNRRFAIGTTSPTKLFTLFGPTGSQGLGIDKGSDPNFWKIEKISGGNGFIQFSNNDINVSDRLSLPTTGVATFRSGNQNPQASHFVNTNYRMYFSGGIGNANPGGGSDGGDLYLIGGDSGNTDSGITGGNIYIQGGQAYNKGTSFSGNVILNWSNFGLVGIRTQDPTRTLDLNGELRIRDVVTDAPTTLIGVDGDGDVGSFALSGLSISGGTITSQNIYNTNGTFGANRQATLTDSLKILVSGNDIFKIKSNGSLYSVARGLTNSFVHSMEPNENYDNITGNVYLSGSTSALDTTTGTRRNKYDASYFSGRNTVTGGASSFFLAIAGYGNNHKTSSNLNSVFGLYNETSGSNGVIFGNFNTGGGAIFGYSNTNTGGGAIFGNGLNNASQNAYLYGSSSGQTQHFFGADDSDADSARLVLGANNSHVNTNLLLIDPTSGKRFIDARATATEGSTRYFGIKSDGVIETAYGTGSKEAASLSKTQSAYIAGFATDGTLLDLEQKRDTTIYVDDADYDFSAALTTAQISRRYNRVIFWMTTTGAAGSDSELTLHPPDVNLMQVEYLIHSVDEAGGFANVIRFGSNNAVDSTNGLVSSYFPAAGDGIHIRAGLRSGVYKYRYSN